MPRAIVPSSSTKLIGKATKPWDAGYFINIYIDGIAVAALPIDATRITTGLLSPDRIANLLGSTIVFGTGRTLSDVSADAALGATDPVGRINAGASEISGTKIEDGTLSPQAINPNIAMAIVLLLAAGGAIQTDDYAEQLTGLKIGNGVFDVNIGTFKGIVKGIMAVGNMFSDIFGSFYFGGQGTPENTHGILADGREWWGSAEYDDAPVQISNRGDIGISDSPQSQNFIDLGAIAPYCRAVMPSVAGGQFSGDLTLTPLTRNASIYYTTDGTDPFTSNTRSLYLAPIPLHPGTGVSITVRAYAEKLGVKGDSSTWVFTGDPNTVGAPTATPIAGVYFNATATLDITLMSGTAGATIIVTTDGTTPTDANGATYVGPIHLTRGFTTIKAFAKKAGLTSSGVATWNYEIRKGGNTGGGGSEPPIGYEPPGHSRP